MKEPMEFAYVSYSEQGIKQFTGGFNNAVVLTEDKIWAVPDDRKKGTAKELDGTKAQYFRDIYFQLTKACPVEMIVLAPNKVKKSTVERWIPEQEQSEHEKALDA